MGERNNAKFICTRGGFANAFKEQKEAGAVDHTAFIAAVCAYRMRYPDVRRNEAALVVFQLVDDLFHGPVTFH